MADYEKGDLVRCSAAFTNIAGAYVDPAAVLFRFKNPGGTTTTYTYGVDAELVKDAVGQYHVDVDANAEGVWFYRFESTGTGQAAGEEAFSVSSEF